MTRNALLVSMLALLLAASVQAAPVVTDQGTKSLIFMFSGLDDMQLSEYAGGIGFRYYMADDLALRPGVEVAYASTTSEAQNPDFTDAESSSFETGVNLVLEKHRPGPVSSLSPYYGAGAGFSIGSFSEEPSRLDDPPEGTLLKHTRDMTGFTFFLVGGFEWGFAEGLTLGGEYRFGARISSIDEERETEGEETETLVDRSAMDLGFSTASLFLSVAW